MPKIPETYQAGSIENLTVEQLYLIMLDMYQDLASVLNLKSDVYETPTDGVTTDTFLENGTININTNTQKVEMLTAHPTINTVTWITLS